MAEGINRALVVDDSRLARIALSKLLQKRNVAVDVVGTGTEALHYLRESEPDVVFMDYMMPDMDGFEATRQIRAQARDGDVPVVMYTSQDTDEDREKARQLGIAGFLSKPSGEHSLDEVLDRLGRMVRGRPGATPAPPPAAPTAPISPPPAMPSSPEITPDTADAEIAELSAVDGGRDLPWIGDEPVESRPPAVESPRRAAEPPPAAKPPPAAEAAPLDLPWPAIRDVARQAADEAVMDAAERAVKAAAAPLREELQGMVDEAAERARNTTGPAAEQAAEKAARGVAETIAERTARTIAERVAEETAGRLADEVSPEVASRVMNDLRRDVRNYVAELFAADAFRDQLVEMVSGTALPALRDTILREAVPKIREQITRDAVRQAERQAALAGREAAETALEDVLEGRLAEFGTSVEARAEAIAAESTARLRGQVLAALVAAGGIAAGALVLALIGVL